MNRLREIKSLGLAVICIVMLWFAAPSHADEPTANQPDVAQQSPVVQQQQQPAPVIPPAVAPQSPPAKPLPSVNHILQREHQLAIQARKDGQAQALANHLKTLREEAYTTKKLHESGAATLGDFWLLQADLLEPATKEQSSDEHQRKAMALLKQFLASHEAGDDPLSRSLMDNVMLSLLRLYDQRGQSDQACKLAHQLSQTASDPVVRAYVAEQMGYCRILGRRFDAKLTTADGKPWNSRDQLGHYLLIHFYADWYAPSTKTDAIAAAQKKVGTDALALLSVRIALPDKQKHVYKDAANSTKGDASPPAVAAKPLAVAWPVYEQGPGQVNLQELFDVRSLPRYVLIDPNGRVAAVGSSLSILEQAPTLLEHLHQTQSDTDPKPVTNPRAPLTEHAPDK